MENKNLSSIIRENKTLFIIIAVGLLLLELEIFALAASKSGKKSWVKVYNAHGSMIHESRGTKLSDRDRDYIEKTFGPLGQFDVKLISESTPFPFRAWFVSAVGIPLAVILLLSFVVKVYFSLFHGDATISGHVGSDSFGNPDETKWDKVLSRIGRYNIYTIGFLVFLAIFAYWVLPNFISYIGKLGVETLIRYKWFFIGVSAILLALVVWIIYLRYLLAKKAMDGRMEMEKYRLELEHKNVSDPMTQISYNKERLIEKNEHTTDTS